MLQEESLPLADVVDSELFEQAFNKFDVDFAHDDEAVYTPALVLWALVSQAMFKDEHRGLTAAVTRIAAWWAAQGRVVKTKPSILKTLLSNRAWGFRSCDAFL